MDPLTPVEPPPPAYDAQHDFDRKISDALERSLTISNPVSATSLDDEEEWEEWDESRFEAAAARAREQESQPAPTVSRHCPEKQRLARQDACQTEQTTSGASSSTSPGPAAPVHSGRRLPAFPPAAKERPSWFAEAQLDTPTGSESVHGNQPSSFQIHHIPPEEDDIDDEALPPFAAVGPSLEGPPFEEVVRQPLRLPPGSDADSPPQSPLDAVEDSEDFSAPTSFAPPPSRTTYNDPRHRSTPQRQQPPPVLRNIPIQSTSARPPPMRFDHSIAYSKQRNPHASQNGTDLKEPVDASAFYNSSVSSLLRPSQQQQAPAPKKINTPTLQTSVSPSVHRTDVHDPNAPVPPVPQVPAPQQATTAPNMYYNSMPNQYSPYSQPQYQQPQQYHPPQQLAPTFYGQHFQGAALVPPPPPPPPPHWPPPNNNNFYGGGYYGR